VTAERITSVVITSMNRKDHVRRAIASALSQTVPLDVLVADDGSTDGTSEMIRLEFPEVRLYRHEISREVCVRRNELMAVANTPIVFSLDDDALFSSPFVVEQILHYFDDERVGAVAIPFIDVGSGTTERQRAPDSLDTYVTATFFGGMVALRKRPFVRVGGYRAALVHQFEEADFCIRLLDVGYVIRLGISDPIHHFVSPVRDRRRMAINGARNNVLFAWQNVPMPYLVPHILGTSVKTLRASFLRSHGRPDLALLGLLHGYWECATNFGGRQPVRVSTYRVSRAMRKRDWVRLRDIEQRLTRSNETVSV
jgi:glycosyltransferase involved in cell wall biosynthesis